MRFLLAGLGLMMAMGASAGEPALEFRDAWVRAVPPVARTTAGYFVLLNRGEAPVTVTGARAGFAAHSMFHEMAEVDGGKRMRHLDELSVPAGGQVTFAPGGRHLMFSGLDPVPEEGQVVPVCLELAAGELCHDFPVRRSAPQ